jgi:MFS transporter, ACS family, tartrate transporter
VFTGTAAAVGIALINSVGNLGGFVGPALMGYLATATGTLQGGLVAVGICLILCGVLAAAFCSAGEN